MGDFTFYRENVDAVQLSVLRLSGTVPTFPTDYTTPRLRISHINGGSEVEDLAYTDMVQVPSSNRWYYKYTIPNTAPFTRYLVTFETTMEGVTTQASEEFKVIPEPGSVMGSGEFPITITLANSVTLMPTAGAIIEVFDKLNPSDFLASTTTDSDGNGTVYLNSGGYLVKFSNTGATTETHTLTVRPDGTYELDGD